MLRGAPLLTHVPFLGVDSEQSIAAGRGNWALPKVLAEFEGDPGLPGLVTVRGDGWELHPGDPWELARQGDGSHTSAAVLHGRPLPAGLARG